MCMYYCNIKSGVTTLFNSANNHILISGTTTSCPNEAWEVIINKYLLNAL